MTKILCVEYSEMVAEFEGGRASRENCERYGRPTTAISFECSPLVENAVCNSRRIMMSELQHDLNLLHGTVINIIQDLGFNTVDEH
jgi:hypothetical protein